MKIEGSVTSLALVYAIMIEVARRDTRRTHARVSRVGTAISLCFVRGTFPFAIHDIVRYRRVLHIKLAKWRAAAYGYFQIGAYIRSPARERHDRDIMRC